MMPDDSAPAPRPRVVPCVPRYPSVPATDGPREADEQPCASPEGACETKAPLCLTDEQQPDSPSVMIWSGKFQMWWRAKDQGMTTDRAKAGIWSLEDAKAATKRLGSDCMFEFHPCQPDEMIAELDAAIAKTEQTLRLVDELELATAGRDAINRLVALGLLRMRIVGPDQPGGPDMLELRRLVRRVEYDEEMLP